MCMQKNGKKEKVHADTKLAITIHTIQFTF